MRYAVILAGGSGTRLWPASRKARPKQFIELGGRSLIGAAIDRGAKIADGGVTIVTAESQVAATDGAIAGLANRPRVIAEPAGRNTAAAIGLAAATLLRIDAEATLVVLPADQRISDEAGFERVANIAFEAVEQTGAIGTLGIVPTRAETGFGYLEVAEAKPGVATPVLRFVEKPDQATAEAYVKGGKHLWNAGIFFASAKRLLEELERQLPAVWNGVTEIAAGLASAEAVYPALPSVSIDKGVMEKARNVITVPAAIGWDDVGSWEAFAKLAAEIQPPDARGNVGLGVPPPLSLAGERNFAMSDDDTLIVTYGVSDLVIVKRGNAVFVVPRKDAQQVRDVVEALEQRGLAKYL
jgi:mannose-1-phosphate guanylyltransferase